jgi:hypothetical protein
MINDHYEYTLEKSLWYNGTTESGTGDDVNAWLSVRTEVDGLPRRGRRVSSNLEASRNQLKQSRK